MCGCPTSDVHATRRQRKEAKMLRQGPTVAIGLDRAAVLRAILLTGIHLGLAGCQGNIGAGGGSTPAGPSTGGGQGAGNNATGAPNQTALVVGHAPIRRLTSGELQNSLVDLLNVP